MIPFLAKETTISSAKLSLDTSRQLMSLASLPPSAWSSPDGALKFSGILEPAWYFSLTNPKRWLKDKLHTNQSSKTREDSIKVASSVIKQVVSVSDLEQVRYHKHIKTKKEIQIVKIRQKQVELGSVRNTKTMLDYSRTKHHTLELLTYTRLVLAIISNYY